jgi:hypothetical protein
MSANVEFNIQAFDQASTVFQDVSSNATECFSTVTSGASEAADEVQSSGNQMQNAMQIGSQSSLQTASSMGAAASSAAMLAMSTYSLESAETSLDKAHVTVEKDTLAVQKAQEAYNIAVLDYGPNSQQAKDAADKLKDSQDSLSVAEQRVTEAQNNVNQTLVMAGLSVIPTVLTTINAMNSVMRSYPAIASGVSSATEAVSGAMDFLAANPIMLVIAGIAALAIGLYEAYEHCAPFRDAVNEIGCVLEGAFKTAVTDICNVLETVWNDVLKPFGEFIASTFIGYWHDLETAFNDVKDALSYLWQNILEPVANFFEGAFSDAINFVMSIIKPFEDAINAVSKALSPITSGIGDLTNALKGLCFAHAAPAAEEFNKQLTTGIELSNNLTQKLDPLKQGLLGVSGGVSVGSASLVNGSGGTQHITVNPTIQIGKIDRSTGLQDVISAVSQGTALALQRRM